MLTIKKRTQPRGVWFGVVVLTLLAACSPPGESALYKGERLFRAGKHKEAIAKLEQATQTLGQEKPELLAQAWNYLGLAYHQSGQAGPAEKAYQEALTLDRDLAEARYNLGNLFLEQRTLASAAKAADQFNTYIQLQPKNVDGFLKLASVYMLAADLTSDAERNRQLEYARTTYENAQRVASTPEGLNGLGVIQISRYQNISDALGKFNEALRLETNYPPALLNLAIVYHQYLDDRRQALLRYKQYLSTQPRPSNAKEVETAIMSLQDEMLRKPSNGVAPSRAPAKTASSAPVRTGSSTQASPEPGTAPASTSRTSTASTGAGYSANASGPEASSLAVRQSGHYQYRTFAKGAAGNTQEALKLLSEGAQAQNSGRQTDALRSYRKAVTADPQCFDAYLRLGLVAQDSGDLQTALESLEHAVALKPESAYARYAFAWNLQKAGHFNDSAKELEKLLSRHPSETRAHLLLGNLCSQQLNKPKTAREHYLKVLEAEPQHPQATAIRYWLAANP